MPRIRPVPAALLLTVALGAFGTGLAASSTPAHTAAVTVQAQDQAATAPDEPPAPGTDDMYWD